MAFHMICTEDQILMTSVMKLLVIVWLNEELYTHCITLALYYFSLQLT